MTAIAPTTAPSLQQLAPHVMPRVKDGDLATAQMVLMLVGVALIGAAWATGGHFYASYLVGYMGVLAICLGALFFTMVQHIVRAGWSVVLRRVAENVAWCLPLMALLFVPILVGFDEIFHHWTHANHDAAGKALAATDAGYDAVLAGKSSWLNKEFFFVRVAIYFVSWIGLAWYFRSKSIAQDETGDPAINLRLSRVAAPGLLVFAMTLTFAAFDWIMSIDPHWFSTIFGVTYFAGAYMAFLASVTLFLMWLNKRGYLQGALTVEHYHDLGKLMFAFMVFWTYVNFGQYMLIWYANLPEETRWFADRAENGWCSVGTILVFGHFFVPFAYLMSRHIKRNAVTLIAGAIWLLVMHCMDMQFLILPSATSGHGAHEAHVPAGHDQGQAVSDAVQSGLATFPHDLGVYLHNVQWADFGCFAGVLALVAGFALWNIRRTNLIPLRDPRLSESLHFVNL